MADGQSKAQKILVRLLLGFALISIGFALGRHTVKSAGEGRATEGMAGAGEGGHNSVVMVYYLHGTFRCVTCNTIEKMTRELLAGEFAQAIEDGRIRMESVDFQQNEAMARRYDVVASCVVVADVRDGEEVAYQRLDEVWTMMKESSAFNRYVGDAIRKYLTTGEAQP